MTLPTQFFRRLSLASLVVSLLLGSAATTFAGYDARKSEAEKMLAEAKMPAEERKALEAALDEYFDAREDCLEALVDIVEAHEDKPQAAVFEARAEACAANAPEPFDDALDDFDPPSIGALGFVNVFEHQEAPFMGGLAGLAVASARDEIVATRVALQEMAENLEEKWEKTTVLDESLDKRMKQETEAITKELQTAAREAAEKNKDAAEKIRKIVKLAAGVKIQTGDPVFTAAKATIGGIVLVWEHFDKSVENRTRAYQNLFRSEARVMVMFTEVRDEVNEFIDENGYPKAEAGHERGESSLGKLVSATSTSGQRSDANSFRSDVMRALDGHLKDTQEIYSDFVSANEHKFFGALGSDVMKELLEKDEWGRALGRLGGFGLDSKLRQWKGNATNYFEVDLSGLTDEQYKTLTKGLRAEIDRLVRAMKESGERWRDFLPALEDGREDVGDKLE